MQEYLLVAQDKLLCELHYRDKKQNWKAEVFIEAEEITEFTSIKMNLTLKDIYRNIQL